MSWMQKLYDTYNQCTAWIGEYDLKSGKRPLAPVCHITKDAHVVVVLDEDGNIQDARPITNQNDMTTIIPATEDSASKVGGTPASHPFVEELRYLAKDYVECGGQVPKAYREQAKQSPHLQESSIMMVLITYDVNTETEAGKKRLRKVAKACQVVGKGGNQEFVYYSRKCQEVLEKWLDIRRSMSAPCDKLFVSLGGISRGEPLTPRGLRIIMKRLGEHAGVKGVHPHAFRRTFATLRIKKGQSTRGVQRLGRWRNLATFERYTHALLTDDEFAKNEANSYSPLP